MGDKGYVFKKNPHFEGHQMGHIGGPKLWAISTGFMQHIIKN